MVVNTSGVHLFDIKAPLTSWEANDWFTYRDSGPFYFDFRGLNQGILNSSLAVYSTGGNLQKDRYEEFRYRTSIKGIKEAVDETISDENFNSFHNPKYLKTGIRQISGINCGYHEFVTHVGPELDTPTEEFRGMGHASKLMWYYCPFFKDGIPWKLSIRLEYQYSDLAVKEGMNINFFEEIENFDRMLAPTFESISIPGELKQY